jgi:hypothetical protein
MRSELEPLFARKSLQRQTMDVDEQIVSTLPDNQLVKWQ